MYDIGRNPLGAADVAAALLVLGAFLMDDGPLKLRLQLMVGVFGAAILIALALWPVWATADGRMIRCGSALIAQDPPDAGSVFISDPASREIRRLTNLLDGKACDGAITIVRLEGVILLLLAATSLMNATRTSPTPPPPPAPSPRKPTPARRPGPPGGESQGGEGGEPAANSGPPRVKAVVPGRQIPPAPDPNSPPPDPNSPPPRAQTPPYPPVPRAGPDPPSAPPTG